MSGEWDWPGDSEAGLGDWLHSDMGFPPAWAERLARRLCEMAAPGFGED